MGDFGVGPHSKRHVTHPHFKDVNVIVNVITQALCPIHTSCMLKSSFMVSYSPTFGMFYTYPFKLSIGKVLDIIRVCLRHHLWRLSTHAMLLSFGQSQHMRLYNKSFLCLLDLCLGSHLAISSITLSLGLLMSQQIVLNRTSMVQTFFTLKGHGSQFHVMDFFFSLERKTI